MDKPHRQLITTYPVAIKYGQGRLHIANPIPWHHQTEAVKCPECSTIYLVTIGFPRKELLDDLKRHHKVPQPRDGVIHADYIASAAEWTSEGPCDCGM